jgi:hypothetical protein
MGVYISNILSCSVHGSAFVCLELVSNRVSWPSGKNARRNSGRWFPAGNAAPDAVARGRRPSLTSAALQGRRREDLKKSKKIRRGLTTRHAGRTSFSAMPGQFIYETDGDQVKSLKSALSAAAVPAR